ncbi:MAG: ISNCY family transposase [Candidatus Daviesbacteria bacterium]|nr:ISNCY family transposase [Candidatus Daviesbacteria bacterium]
MPDIPLKEEEKQKLEVIINLLDRKITNGEAAKKLRLSIRHIQRLKLEVRKHGVEALVHHLKGKPSNHKLNQIVKGEALSLIEEKYSDFHPTLASEKLEEYHNLYINPETLRLWMIEKMLWKGRKQRKIHYHAWRERKDYFGDLEQFDGSYHFWFEDRLLDEYGNPKEVCLLASIDDATGKVTHALFDFNEGVVAVFNFWKAYVLTLGKPLSIYLDKFSTYKLNHKSAVDNSDLMTQFQKAMKLLDIQVINANSPEAKGRVERLFGTLQDRLVKELRLAGISTIKDGNKFLKDIFIPKFNNRFSVIPAKDGNVHRQLTQQEKRNLKSIFSVKSTRRVNSDYTIQFKNHFYQLEEIQPATIRTKEKILVEEHLDETIHFRFKEHYLKCFILPKRPRKILRQPAILTTHPLNWKPPPDHPWRSFKFSIKRG